MAEVSVSRVADLSRGELRSFISRLKERNRTEDAPIPPRVSQDGQDSQDGPLPLSFSQERLWFLDRLGEGSAPYAIPSAVRLSGALDPDVLRRAFAELVRRHESLRTTFGEQGGVPFQVVAAEADVPLPRIDLSLLPGPRREAEVLRLAGEEARRPFDLARGPLLRNLLVRLGPEDHVLAMTMHHIVSDGWSMTVLIREIAALYDALAAGRPSPLPALPIQYTDFTVWQRQRLGSERMRAEVAWWRERLAGLEPLEIPTDRPRPAVESHRGARRRLSLSGATAARLQDFARREGVTPFMMLLALWDVLLFRYSGQTDIAVGTPVANRNRSELEGLIGFFVNTLVLRSDLSGRPGFRELLGRVREVTLGAYAHEELPFEKLVEHLQPERLRDRNPLFQVMCTLQNQPWPELRLGAMRITPLALDTGIAKLDLNLTWVEQEGALEGTLEYSTDLWDSATAQRLLRHYLALVRAACEEPERAIGELPLLGEVERRQVLVDWNRTARDYPREATVHALFEERARISGDEVAIISAEERSTYAELNARANQLARHLRRLGVEPESLVGLAVPRSLDMVVGILGILKAGGAYVPLDPSYPRERLEWMLEDTRPRALVTLEPLLADLPSAEARVICLDRDRDAIRSEDPGDLPDDLPGETTADNLVYVLYTSGSTGRPKGVAVPHRAVVRLVRGSEFVHLGEEEVFLQFAPLAFDASTLEIWGPLLNGGRLALAPPGALSLPELRREIERHGATTLWLTAGLFHQMVEGEIEGLRPLRQLLAGGEALSVPHVQRALAALPGCALVNGYGPTENTTFTCCHRLTDGEALTGSVPVGRPIANTRVYLLDSEREPVPVGVPGELCAGGDGLARGYLGRPDLTAERFVPDPCSGEPGARLYRTGDLARFRPDGVVELLGRMDQQVKIRGFRVEPGEVEAVLLEHPAASACAVLVRQDRPGDRRLVAYMAPAGASVAELRSFLAAKLPAYMVPAAFVLLPELPLNPNGKVDRRALARLAPPADDAFAAGEHVAPGTPTELRVAEIWKGLLGVERVGLHDSFFALGGHSLLAVQLVSRLRDGFGVDLPLGAVFEEPSLAALAEKIEAALQAGPAADVPPLVAVPRGEPLPLSFAQERLWFLEQLEPGSAFYNIPSATRLTGPLRVDVLRRCLAEMIRRHESLRTTFEDFKGQPFQRIALEGAAESPVIDLSALPPPVREEELLRRATGEARRPFDLARGPLFRAPLFRLSPMEHVILPNMHHIVSDGWSMTVVNREMASLYAAFAAGRPSPLPGLPVQYADYAVWQRSHLQGEALEAKMAYWRERLAGVPGLQIPTDRPRPAVETFRGRQRAVGLPAGLTRELHDLALGEGVTLFMTLLAAFQALLLRYTGQTDIPVGSPVANRYRSDVEGVIGFFANTVVLRTDLSGSPSFRELLGRVREVTLGAYAHEDLPFERLVEELQPERDMSRNPLFQVMCVLQNQPWPALRMGDVELSPVLIDSATAKFDLTLFWRESDGALRGVLEHNTDLFDDSTALRFYRHYEALLRTAVEDPGRPVGALPLLDDAEQHQILLEWNRPWTGEWAGRCVHRWVEEQVARTPEELAVVDGGRRLTYAELNAQANRLAHGLRRLGVRPESLVGICVERSLEMVVAALAVLKAGGALVALDPAYPRERLATIIDDARLTVLLTQASLLQHFPQHTGIALLLERDAEPFPRESGENPASGVDLDNPIYAIYTSGSTGQPKGILVTHRAFSSLLAWQLGDPGLRPGARTVQLSTFGFCVSFQEMFSSWCSGGALVLADEMTRRDLGGLGAFLESRRIERLHLPFAALKHLAEAAAGQAHLPSGLSAVITAGEQLQVTPAVRALFERLPGCTLSNQYGASETHVISALTLCGDPGTWPSIPPVGRPVANVRIHLLDADLRPVPVGVAGELYAAGACVARCYLNDPVLTAQKLVPDPYSPVPGGRLYRTGDSARYLADGRIEYHGRIDTQVKIRGFRVELGEIDTVLARHPGVRDAAVVARAGRDGQRLVAYVVPAGPETAPAGELRAWLKRKLPEHMVPAAFVEMAGLPVNANGKLDQAALPEPEMQPGSRAEYVAPRTPVEELLAGMYAELLDVETVGIHDSFFELGGHSLKGTRLMAQVRDAFGVDLKVRTLFESPTVAELAVAIARALVELADDESLTDAFAEIEREGALDHV